MRRGPAEHEFKLTSGLEAKVSLAVLDVPRRSSRDDAWASNQDEAARNG